MNIVQIGSNDCFSCDDCFKFVEQHHKQIDTIVCVDPNMDKLSNCLKVYENFDFDVQILGQAVVAEESLFTVRLYYSNEEKNAHHTSVNKNHLLKMGWEPDSIYHIDHPACTANQVFGMAGLTTIDRLYVDCEGYDLDILDSIDYSVYDIRWIRFETLHTQYPIHKYYTKMGRLGYKYRHGPTDAEVWKDE